MAFTAVAPIVFFHLPAVVIASSVCRSALETDLDTPEEVDSSLSLLQVRRSYSQSKACDGEWCGVLTNFCHLFDSNRPMQMQKAFDMYTEYASPREGIKLAVTKDHFYEMYHGNVGRKLAEYLPQRLFAWDFNDDFQRIESSAEEVKIARSGTVSFNMGWWRRNMFWNNVVQSLPRGEVFPFSTVSKFNDCKRCPAKMVFTLRKGGLNGGAGEWKVVGVSLIKLK